MKEPKAGKKEIFYDILGGTKYYYVGRTLTYPDGRTVTERIHGPFRSEQEALRYK